MFLTRAARLPCCAPAKKRRWSARVEQAAGMGASVLQVSKFGRRTLGGQWGGGWGQRGPGKVGVRRPDMEGSLRVPLRPLGTVLDLRNLGKRLRSPLAS